MPTDSPNLSVSPGTHIFSHLLADIHNNDLKEGFLPWLAPALACEAFFDAPLTLGSLGSSDTETLLCGAGLLVAFAVLEVAIPRLHVGSTLGGLFVRMSCETRPRTGWHRALFYAVRSVVLIAVFALPPYVIPILALFYLIARKMPYDFLP